MTHAVRTCAACCLACRAPRPRPRARRAASSGSTPTRPATSASRVRRWSRTATSWWSGRATPGRQRRRRLRPAVRRGGRAAGRRVPGQHLHDGQPDRQPSRSGAGGTSWWSGRAAQDGSAPASTASASTPRAAPLGGEFLVNTFTTGDQYCPRVGRGRRRQVRRGLDERESTAAPTGSSRRRFDASGRPIGGEFLVNTYTTGDQDCGDVAVEADGNFVVVWEDDNDRDGSGTASSASATTPRATALGGEFQVNTLHHRRPAPPVGQHRPRRAASWSPGASPRDGTGNGVFARRFDALGDARGRRVRGQHVHHRRQVRPAGRSPSTRAATSSSPGSGPATASSTASSPSASTLGRPPRRRVPASTRYTTGSQDRPSVASDAVGNFVVAWDSSGQDGSDCGVFAQRFGGLQPRRARRRHRRQRRARAGRDGGRAALLAQRQRRRADLRRHARPTSPAPRAPPTRSPTPPATTGRWPTARPRQCTDCYAVLGVQPATRPALHWDASAVESIMPDAQGQQKHWRLHVGDSFTDVPRTNPLLPLRRDAAAPRRHRRLRRRPRTARPARPRASRWRCSCWWRRKAPATSPPACAHADVRRRAGVQPLLPLDRGAGAPGRGRAAAAAATTARPSAVTREQMAVFVLRTLDPGAQPAGLHDADVRRRAGDQPLLPLDRGAGPPRRGHRLRRRQLLPDRGRDPRADGRVHQRDVRPDAVRTVAVMRVTPRASPRSASRRVSRGS